MARDLKIRCGGCKETLLLAHPARRQPFIKDTAKGTVRPRLKDFTVTCECGHVSKFSFQASLGPGR